MAEEIGEAGAGDEEDVGPAVEVRLGKEMVSGEEGDQRALPGVREGRSVGGERGKHGKLAEARGVAEPIDSHTMA
jgi:hypothetical protein